MCTNLWLLPLHRLQGDPMLRNCFLFLGICASTTLYALPSAHAQ